MCLAMPLPVRFPCVLRLLPDACWFAACAGMYVYCKLPPGLAEKGIDDLVFCQQLVATTGVAISPGRGFGPGGVGHVRFALVRPEEVLERAGKTIAEFAERLLQQA